MKTNLPPKGMRDFLPYEKKCREKIMSIILDEYKKSGFDEIETSIIENLENLVSSNSGENTKLIYKILKRGDKFNPSETSKEDDLADLGLRFDLTLPLSRYYANNRNELPTVFKALQTGYVFRAERPGKGRFRSFKQCDVDIIGDSTFISEVELISTIYKTLDRIGLKNQVIKINDRRFLKAVILKNGFSEDTFTDVAISLDKADKIGMDGVKKELLSKGYDNENVDKLLFTLSEIDSKDLSCIKDIDKESYDNLSSIISVLNASYPNLKIEFTPNLVRGMGYYTGTIFELFYEGSSSAIGGGGRYDNMIEKLSGASAPACGFSIGYERLVDIVVNEKLIDVNNNSLALFYSLEDDLSSVLRAADKFREKYDKVSIMLKKKKFGKQLSRLKSENYDYFVEYDNEDMVIKES